MKEFNANDKNIIYIGNWDNTDCGMTSKNDYCKAVFMFKGNEIKIKSVGTLFCSLDGEIEVKGNCFSSKDGVHTLFLTAEKGSCIKTIETDELLDADVYLRSKTNNEYLEILQGRRDISSENFAEIEFRANCPQARVKLKGIFGELFDKNVRRIKKCAKAPYYIETNIDTEEPTPGWADWLPAANEGGRILGGAAKALKWTDDSELKEIVHTIVEKVSAQMRDDGYYNYYPEEDSFAANHFPYIENPLKIIMDSEKKNFDRTYWTYGMVAAGEIGNKKAFELARQMYDWLENSDWRRQLILGHNGTNAHMGSLILADSEAGKPEDIMLNRKYLDRKTLEEELIKKNPLIFSNFPGDRPHCYVILELLALIYEYRLTGEEHYLKSTLGGWEVYKKYYKHTGGLTAVCELDGPYPPGSYHVTKGHTGETCGTVFWIWLNQQLLQLFPDEEQYACEIEEGLLNIIPQLFVWDEGVRYHNRLAGKKNEGASVSVSAAGTCCELTATLLYSELPQYGFSYNSDGIWLNQFMSYDAKCKDIEFSMESDIFGGCAKIDIRNDVPSKKFIRIRIPHWMNNAEIALNGKVFETGKKGTYAEIRKAWCEGDRITITFSPEIKLVPYTGAEQPDDGKKRYALLYGPYLMALTGNFKKEIPCVNINISDMKIEKTETSIKINIGNNLKFIPYFEIDNSQNFNCFPIFE